MSRLRERGSPFVRLDELTARRRLVGFDERGYDKHQEEHREQLRSGRIRCPHCNWEPQKTNLWFCITMGPPENNSNGCGNGWHTFDTRGVCPTCSYRWKYTTCLACNQWAPHDDWYVAGSGGAGSP